MKARWDFAYVPAERSPLWLAYDAVGVACAFGSGSGKVPPDAWTNSELRHCGASDGRTDLLVEDTSRTSVRDNYSK
jgi:hypothetical protein